MTTDELNEAIQRLCEERGMNFAPWECHPADANDGPCPWPVGCVGAESWPKAQALRRKLIAEFAVANATA